MAYWHCQFDMAHPFAADPRQGDLHSATVADHAAMLDALVFPARTFPVLYRPEDPFAEQAAFFRLERAVINSFRVLDLSFGPGSDCVRRGDGNRDIFDLIDLVQTEQLSSAFFGANHKNKLYD